MKGSDNDKRICILVKQLADLVGRATGEEYCRSLIKSINKCMELSCVTVYRYNDIKLHNQAVLAEELEHYNKKNILSALDILVSQQIISNVDHNIIINLDGYCEIQEFEKPILVKSLISFPLYDPDNNYIGLIIFACTNKIAEQSIVIDVLETQVPRVVSEFERLRINKKLTSLENEYYDLINTTHDVVWEADIDGNIKAINGACEAIYGYSDRSMIGKSYTDYMTDDSSRDFKRHLETIVQGDAVANVKSDHISKDYVLIKVSYNIIPKFDENNGVIGVIGTTRDISASVRAHEAIKNNSELFSSILSRLPVIFFRVDEKGFLVDIRGNGLKRMGVEDMDWVGRPGYGLFIGMDAKIDSALCGSTVFFENKGTYKGKPWWFYTSMFFDSWSGYGAVGFSVDITEQKNIEEQLVELLNSNRQLAQKLVEVQEEERRNLARELHDELGQSITAVKSLATVISTNANNQHGKIKDLANSIIGLSGQLYEVVNNIMQRLRPDIIDNLDFNETINNCIVRSQLEAVGINCELSITGNINDLDEVVKITIFRIVQECLTNVSKHAMASNVTVHIQRLAGVVETKCVKSDNTKSRPELRDTVKIEITDDGVGMNVNNLGRNNTHAKRHGLEGINERVSAMGGNLTITGVVGKGVKIQAVLVLGETYQETSHDNNTCVSDLKKLSVG